MQKIVTPKRLPATAVVLGAAALVLRRLLYLLALDGKGLLVTGHPVSLALLALSAAALLTMSAAVRKLDGSQDYGDNFQASFSAGAGHVLLASGILMTMLTRNPMMPGYLGRLWTLFGWASPLCLMAAGVCRAKGTQPYFLLHLVPCLFLLFHIICHYQVWCGDPQLQNYVFTLFGTIALMLFLFYTAAFEVGSGKRRMHMGLGLTAAFLCLAELALSRYPFLYIGGIVFALTNLCSPYPRPKRTAEEA